MIVGRVKVDGAKAFEQLQRLSAAHVFFEGSGDRFFLAGVLTDAFGRLNQSVIKVEIGRHFTHSSTQVLCEPYHSYAGNRLKGGISAKKAIDTSAATPNTVA